MKIFNKSEWKKVKLGDICEVITGNTPSKKIKEYWDKDEVPFITPPELKYEGINYITPSIFVSKIGAKQGRIISKNSICVCCIGSLGKLGILKDDAITNQQINSLILKDKNIDLLYLYFYLKTTKNNLEAMASSTTVKIINKSSFEKIEIKLPDIRIQKKISKKLEILENNINFRKKQLIYLKELNKSLFIRMFGDPLTNDRIEWKFSKIKNIGKIISGSTPNTNTPELWNGDYLWITPAELKDDSFIVNSTERKLTYLGIKKSSLIEMPIGTVLLSSRAPIGKVAIVGKNMFCNQGFKNIIPNEEINSIYLYYILKEKKEYLNFLGRGATFKELSKEIVENISLKIPPIELQNKFAERVEKIEKLSFEIEKSIKEAENLYNSLISKYFD
ncbi:restriction endonuclease subunit S [Fusobacterium hwasookii]|uniref:Type I restriction modification enzyme protein S n=1 Tax=Fusobacterium hwasookii ChDC F128 TaxID=1216362 RepID=A0ABN0H373_9FUSO|nr:restriction endonuclease subunit S [Fusobacterium hwasookii]EJU08712.1 type I restriction modification enzyme protein S [Fusobacterium hwasookii ChDC F128]QNE67022.1 restriction endonuclease subunit S [Fusobacterium hwasookii]